MDNIEPQQPARLTEEECRFIQYFRNLAESEQLILIRQIEENIIDTEQGENMNKKKTPLPKDF
jgi:hypothetical protein